MYIWQAIIVIIVNAWLLVAREVSHMQVYVQHVFLRSGNCARGLPVANQVLIVHL